MADLGSFIIKDTLNVELNIIEKNGLLGLTDKKTNDIVLDCEYNEISGLSKYGFASVKKGNKYGAIDKYGKIVFPCVIEEVLFKVDNMVVVKALNKNIIIDERTYKQQGEYEEISFMKSPYAQNLALVRNGLQYGILDVLNNREIVKCEYTKIEEFTENNYAVENGELKGVLSKEGDVVLDCVYLEIVKDDFSFNVQVKNEENLWGVVNKETGKVIVPCEYTNIECFSTESNVELRRVEKEGKIGIYNTAKKEEVVPCVYDNLEVDNNLGVINVEKDGKFGLLNEKGETLVDCVADKKFERINEHFISAGEFYCSVVTKQLFTKNQFELINQVNTGLIDYNNLPEELLSSARSLKELVELARYDLKQKDDLVEEDTVKFAEFTNSILEQKTRYELKLCEAGKEGLNITEIQEFSSLCHRNIESISVNLLSIKNLTYEFKDEEGENNGRN